MDDIIDVLKRDCQPFIKEFGVQPYNPVYRGTQKEMSDYILKVRSRRKMVPKDTPKHLHDLMDELFFKYHGWKAESSHEAMFKCYEYYIVSFENNAFDTKFLQRLKKSL